MTICYTRFHAVIFHRTLCLVELASELWLPPASTVCSPLPPQPVRGPPPTSSRLCPLSTIFRLWPPATFLLWPLPPHQVCDLRHNLSVAPVHYIPSVAAFHYIPVAPLSPHLACGPLPPHLVYGPPTGTSHVPPMQHTSCSGFYGGSRNSVTTWVDRHIAIIQLNLAHADVTLYSLNPGT